ncbi:hypothetical protein PoB_002673700 [Plakobranchus ocellatus]|uniref:Uncharacterized protein n=1 Tax=Plakobranchus ocellatus TaxID=259542 RepID=A0AAV3ZYW3_9GAST|nr:hypothetical protein PoB_002673700 [Plakobranchus ocellatus]
MEVLSRSPCIELNDNYVLAMLWTCRLQTQKEFHKLPRRLDRKVDYLLLDKKKTTTTSVLVRCAGIKIGRRTRYSALSNLEPFNSLTQWGVATTKVLSLSLTISHGDETDSRGGRGGH